MLTKDEIAALKTKIEDAEKILSGYAGCRATMSCAGPAGRLTQIIDEALVVLQKGGA